MKFSELVLQLQTKTEHDLESWIYNYLTTTGYSLSIPGLENEKPLVVKRIYYESGDPEFQMRIGISISNLLESCDPVIGKEEYLFYLLTIIPIIRPQKAKQRLKYLLFSKALENFHFDVFDLNVQLIAALCEYDIDQTLKDYIFTNLANRSNFKDYAIVCYRGLMHMYDESPFLLIPKIAPFLFDELFYKDFIYLFKISIERIGIITFARVYSSNIMNELKSVDGAYSNKVNQLLLTEILMKYKNFNSRDYIKLLLQCNNEFKFKLTDSILKQLLNKIPRSDHEIINELFKMYGDIEVIGIRAEVVKTNIEASSIDIDGKTYDVGSDLLNDITVFKLMQEI